MPRSTRNLVHTKEVTSDKGGLFTVGPTDLKDGEAQIRHTEIGPIRLTKIAGVIYKENLAVGTGEAQLNFQNVLSGGVGGSVPSVPPTIQNQTTFSDDDFMVYDGSNTSNEFKLLLDSAGGDTRTWTVPGASDTFVGKATTDILTNKTLSSNCTVSASLQWSASQNFRSEILTNVNIDNGTIDNTVIGSSTAVAGTFTTITGTKLKCSFSGTALDINGAADISGDLTLSAGGDGALRFSTASSIKILDNSATSLVIEENNTAYLTFDTANGSESIVLGKKLEAGGVEIEGTAFDINGGNIDDTIIGAATAVAGTFSVVTGTSLDINGNADISGDLTLNGGYAALSFGIGSTILIADNLTDSLIIAEGGNAYLKFTTSEGSEKIVPHKKIEAGAVEIEGRNFDVNGGTIDDVTIGTNAVATQIIVDNIDLDGNTISTGSGALTLDGTSGVNIIGNSSEVDITTTGAIDINSAALDIDASGAITIDGTSTILISGDGGATFSDDTEAIVYDGSGNLDFDTVALDIDSSGAITIDSASTVAIVGASTVAISGASTSTYGDDTAVWSFNGSGALSTSGITTFSLSTSSTVDINCGGVLTLDGSSIEIGVTADKPIDINSTTLDIDASGALTIDSATSISIGVLADKPIDIDASTFDLDASGALTLTSTTMAFDPSSTFDLDAAGAITIDGSSISLGTDSDVAFDIDTSTLDIDSSGAITIDSTAGISLDAGAASNFTTGSGSLTLSGRTGVIVESTSSGDIIFDSVTGIFEFRKELGITADSLNLVELGAGNWQYQVEAPAAYHEFKIGTKKMLKIDANYLYISDYDQTLYNNHRIMSNGGGYFYTHGQADFIMNYSFVSNHRVSTEFEETYPGA